MFGNIPILLGRDFAQILPVVRRGNQAQTVAACIQQSYIWNLLQVFNLKINMRIIPGTENEEFASWLTALSYNSQWEGNIRFPPFIRTVMDFATLCSFIYLLDQLQLAHLHHTAFNKRAILAPHNDIVTKFNMLKMHIMHTLYAS